MNSMKNIRDGHKCWKTFQMVLNRMCPRTPLDVSRKIQLDMIGGELREKYLKGLPKLWASTKLDMSLEEIINPIEAKEKQLTKMKKDYHPGRLLLIKFPKVIQPIELYGVLWGPLAAW